jgi:hypothetical protein
MKSFNDTENRRWDLSLSIATVKRVRNLTDVDLLSILDKPELLSDLAADPVRLVDVLYVVCKPQADAMGVTDEQFGESLDGQSIESATECFLEALVDFFPGARRATLKRVLDRANQFHQKSEATLMTALSDGSIDKAIEDALIGGETSTKSPAELASNPAT